MEGFMPDKHYVYNKCIVESMSCSHFVRQMADLYNIG